MKLILTACLFLIFCGCSSKKEQTSSATTDKPGSTIQNKELIKRLFNDMANKRNYVLIDSLFAPNIIDHSAFEGQQQGREGIKKAIKELLDGFSTLEITLQDIIAEGELVATRETWNVTMASNGKAVTGETIHI